MYLDHYMSTIPHITHLHLMGEVKQKIIENETFVARVGEEEVKRVINCTIG